MATCQEFTFLHFWQTQAAACVSHMDARCVLPVWPSHLKKFHCTWAGGLWKMVTTVFAECLYSEAYLIHVICYMLNIIDLYCSIYSILPDVCANLLYWCGFTRQKHQIQFFVYFYFGCNAAYQIVDLLSIGHSVSFLKPMELLKAQSLAKEILQIWHITIVSYLQFCLQQCAYLHHRNGVSSDIWTTARGRASSSAAAILSAGAGNGEGSRVGAWRVPCPVLFHSLL